MSFIYQPQIHQYTNNSFPRFFLPAHNMTDSYSIEVTIDTTGALPSKRVSMLIQK